MEESTPLVEIQLSKLNPHWPLPAHVPTPQSTCVPLTGLPSPLSPTFIRRRLSSLHSMVSTPVYLSDPMLKTAQSSSLRVFRIGQDLISTRESTQNLDPTEVSFVDSDPHHGNLWPSEIDIRRRKDPIPQASVVPGRPRHGFPLCWSRPGFEWYPYLPAVCSFHYPIFRGMKSAAIVSTGSGWKLRDEDILHWSSVEFVILRAINILGRGQLSALEHVEPHWPSSFGYKRLHSSEKNAITAKTASLNAFQRMLAYCSYASAFYYAKNNSASLQFERYFFSPTLVEDIFKRFGENPIGSNVHVLLKFLLATLGEIHRTENFVGIVVSYHREFHYPAVKAMHMYGLPVYVRWHETLKLQSYQSYDQHHMLNDWLPKLDDFKILEAPLATDDSLPPSTFDEPSSSAPMQHPQPTQHFSTAKSNVLFANPMEYINRRKAAIQKKLENSEVTQSMKDRQKSAMKFGYRGHKGPPVYEFEVVDHVDPKTGQQSRLWERRCLTKLDAQRTYDAASAAQLWYVSFPHFPLCDLLTGVQVRLRV